MMYRDKCCNREKAETGPPTPSSDIASSPNPGREGDQLDRGPPSSDRLRDKLLDSEVTGLGGELSILASLADAERHRRAFTGFPLMELPLTDSDDGSNSPPNEEQWTQLQESAEHLDPSKMAALSSAFSNHISSPKHSKGPQGDHSASVPPMGQFLLPLVTQNIQEPSSGMVTMAEGIMQTLESEGRNCTLREVFFLWLSNYKEMVHKDPSVTVTQNRQQSLADKTSDVRKQIDDALKLLFLLAHCTDDEESQWVINEVNAKLNAQKALIADQAIDPNDPSLRELLDNAHKVIDIILIRLNDEPVGAASGHADGDVVQIKNFADKECVNFKDTRLVKNITRCINDTSSRTTEARLSTSQDDDAPDNAVAAAHDSGDGDSRAGDTDNNDDNEDEDDDDDDEEDDDDDDDVEADADDNVATAGATAEDKESDEAIKNMPVDILTKFESFNKFLENSPLRSTLEQYMMSQMAVREAESRRRPSGSHPRTIQLSHIVDVDNDDDDDDDDLDDDDLDDDEELPQKIFDCDSINTWERFIGREDGARRRLCPGGCGNANACSRYRRQKGDGRAAPCVKSAGSAKDGSTSRSHSQEPMDVEEDELPATAKDLRKECVERNPPDSARFIDLQWAWWELRALLASVWHAAERRGECDVAVGAKPPCHCCRCALLRATMHPLQDLLKQMHETSENMEKCTCQRKRRPSVRGGVNRGRSKHREPNKQDKCRVCTSHNAESRLKLLGLLWGRGEPPSACCCRSKMPSGDTCKVTIYFKDPAIEPLHLDLAKDDTVDQVTEEDTDKPDPESEEFFASCYKKFVNGDEDIPRGDEGVVPICQRCRCMCGRARFYCPKQRDITISENIDNFTRLAPQLLILRLDTLCAALCARHSARLAQLLLQGAVMTLLKELWRRAAAMRAGGLALSGILGPARRRLATVCGRLLAPHRFLTAVYRAWADRAAASRVVHLSMLLLLGEEPPLTMDALRSFSSLLSMMTEAETLDADVTVFLGNYRQCERDDYLDRITTRYREVAQDCLGRASTAGLLEDDPYVLPKGTPPDSEMWEVCWQLRACLPREQHDLDEFKRIVQAMLVCNTVGGFTHLAGRLVGGVLGGRLGKNSELKDGTVTTAVHETPPDGEKNSKPEDEEDDDYWRSKRQLVEGLLRERDHTRRMQVSEDPTLGCHLQNDDCDRIRSRPVKRKLKPHNPDPNAIETQPLPKPAGFNKIEFKEKLTETFKTLPTEVLKTLLNATKHNKKKTKESIPPVLSSVIRFDGDEENLLRTMPRKFVVKDVDLYERWGSTICLMQSSSECGMPGGRWECIRNSWKISKSCPNIKQQCGAGRKDLGYVTDDRSDMAETGNGIGGTSDMANVETLEHKETEESSLNLTASSGCEELDKVLNPELFIPATSSVDPSLRIELKSRDSHSGSDTSKRRDTQTEDKNSVEESLNMEVGDQENLRAQMLECLNKMEILGLDEFNNKRASEELSDVSSPPLHELSPTEQTPAYSAALNQNRRLLALNQTLRRGQTDISHLLNTAHDIMAQEKSILKELIDYELSGVVKKEDVETDQLLDDVMVREAPPLPFLEDNDLNQLDGTGDHDKETWEYSPLSSPKTLKEVMQYISESDGIPDLINRILTHDNKYPSHNLWKIAQDHCFLTPETKKQLKEVRLAKTAKKQVCGKRKNGNSLKKVSTFTYENKPTGKVMKFEDPSKEEIMVEMLGHRDSSNGFTQKEFQTKLFTASIQVVMRKVLKVMMCDDEHDLEALDLEGKFGSEFDVRVGNSIDGHSIDDYWEEIKSHFMSWRQFTLEQYWGLTEPCRKPANRADYLKGDAKLREIQEEAEKMAAECKKNNKSSCYVCKDCESVKLKESSDVQDDPIKKRAVKKTVANKITLETKTISKTSYITPVEHAMFVEKLQAVNKDYVDKLLKQNFTGEDWILTMNELQKLERKLKSAVGKQTPSTPAPPTKNTDEAREAELLAGRGLSKLINQFSSKKTTADLNSKSAVVAVSEVATSGAIVTACAAIITTSAATPSPPSVAVPSQPAVVPTMPSRVPLEDIPICSGCDSGGKCLCDKEKDRQFCELKIKAKKIEDTLKMLKEKDDEEKIRERDARLKKMANEAKPGTVPSPRSQDVSKEPHTIKTKTVIKKIVITNPLNNAQSIIAMEEEVPDTDDIPTATQPPSCDKAGEAKKAAVAASASAAAAAAANSSPGYRPRKSDVAIVNGVAMKGGVPIKDSVTIRDIIGYREPIVHPSKLSLEPAVAVKGPPPGLPGLAKVPAVAARPPVDTDHHHQHVCTVNHGGDNCSGNPESGRCSQHPASPRPDQPCNCCYCTVFGHAPPVTTPVSKNFNETRERLRSILNRKKQRCRPAGSQSSQGDSETSDGAKTSAKEKTEDGCAGGMHQPVSAAGAKPDPVVTNPVKPLPPNVIKPVPTNTVKPLPSNPIKPVPVNMAYNPNAKSTLGMKPIPVPKPIPVNPTVAVKPNSTNPTPAKPIAPNPTAAKPNIVNPAAKPAISAPKLVKPVTANVVPDPAKKQMTEAAKPINPQPVKTAPVPKPKSRPDPPNLNPIPPPAVQPNVQDTIKSLKEATNISIRNKEVTGASVVVAEAPRPSAQAPARESARRLEREASKVDQQNQKNAKKYKLVACIENKAIQTEQKSQSQQSPANQSPAPQPSQQVQQAAQPPNASAAAKPPALVVKKLPQNQQGQPPNPQGQPPNPQGQPPSQHNQHASQHADSRSKGRACSNSAEWQTMTASTTTTTSRDSSIFNSTSSVCSGCSGYRVRVEDTRDLNMLVEFIEGPGRTVDKVKKQAKKARQKAKKLLERLLIEQGELKEQMTALSNGVNKLRGEASRLEKLLIVSTSKRKPKKGGKKRQEANEAEEERIRTVQNAARDARARARDAEAALQTASRRLGRVQQTIDNLPEILRQQLSAEISGQSGGADKPQQPPSDRPKQPSPPHEAANHSPAPHPEQTAVAQTDAGAAEPCMVTIKRVLMPDCGPSVTITPRGSDKPIYFFQQSEAAPRRENGEQLDASTQQLPPPAQKKEKASMSWESTIAQMHALSQSKKKPKTPKVEPKSDPPKQLNKKQTNNQASTNSSIIQSRSASTVSELSSTELNLAPSKKQRKILERKLREQQAEQERIQNEMELKAAKRLKEKTERYQQTTKTQQEQPKPKFETKASKKFYETDIIVSMANLKVNKKFEEIDLPVKPSKKSVNAQNTSKQLKKPDVPEVMTKKQLKEAKKEVKEVKKEGKKDGKKEVKVVERQAPSPGLKVVGGKGTLKQNPKTGAVQQTSGALNIKKPAAVPAQPASNTHVRSAPQLNSGGQQAKQSKQASSNGMYNLNSDITIELANNSNKNSPSPPAVVPPPALEQQIGTGKSGPVSCSIMEQLKNGVQVADLKLPPGITLTWVDPAKQQAPNPTPKTAIPTVKLSNVAPECRPSPPVVAPPALIMVDTTKLQAARDIKAQQLPPAQPQQTQPSNQNTKSKKSKKKSKKPPPNLLVQSETSTHNRPRGDEPRMVTLRNPMFHPTLPAVSVSSLHQQTGKRVGESIRIPDPIPMPPNQCQATITPTSNGMFTIRNPLMSMVHQQNMMALGGQKEASGNSPVILMSNQSNQNVTSNNNDVSREITGRMADLGIKQTSGEKNTAVNLNFAPNKDRGYSLFNTDDAVNCEVRNNNCDYQEFASVAPSPIGSNKHLRKEEKAYQPRPEPVGTPRRADEEIEGFYTPFGHSEPDKLFGSLLFHQNSRDDQPYSEVKQSVWSPVTGNEDHSRGQPQFYPKMDSATANSVEISLIPSDQKSSQLAGNLPIGQSHQPYRSGPQPGYPNAVSKQWNTSSDRPTNYQPYQDYPANPNPQPNFYHTYNQYGQQINQPPLRSSHSSSSSGLMTGSVISSGTNSVYDSVSNSSSNSPAETTPANHDTATVDTSGIHQQQMQNNSPPETGRIDGRNYADFSPYVTMLQQQPMSAANNCYNPMFGRVSESPNAERIVDIRIPEMSNYGISASANNFGYGNQIGGYGSTGNHGRQTDGYLNQQQRQQHPADYVNNENNFIRDNALVRNSSEFTPNDSIFSSNHPNREFVDCHPRVKTEFGIDTWTGREPLEARRNDDESRFGGYGPIGSSTASYHGDQKSVGVIGSNRASNGTQKAEDFYRADTRSVFAPDASITNLNELDSTERDIESFKRFDFYFQPPKHKPKISLNLRDIVAIPKSRDK